MEKITVRLLITRPPPLEQQTLEVSVEPSERLENLNRTIFTEYTPNLATIKWIYMGKSLSDRLPDEIETGSAFHFLIRQIRHEDTRARSSTTDSTDATKKMDRILLAMIHGIFVIFLSYLWNRYLNYRHEFEMLSSFLLFVFSILVIVSLTQSVLGS